MDSVEVPQYFTCPISLQIMKDPVTTITGITYDRESIERWLLVDDHPMCPVTKQPLPRDSDLTPNHTLRRLIQAWCVVNASRGVERIPTPRAPVDGPGIRKLVHGLSAPRLQLDSLNLIAALARENESNRRCMLQYGVAGAMVDVINTCTERKQMDRIDVALGVLDSLRASPDDLKPIVDGDRRIIDSMTWILQHGAGDDRDVRSTATVVLKSVIEAADSRVLEQLTPDFFQAVLSLVRDRISQRGTKAALQVLLHAGAWGRNRIKIVEAGGVKEIVELELTAPDKRTTEINLGLLNQLCTTADGRAELVGHAAGIATVSKRILRVSSLADDQGVRILWSLCRYSATTEVLQEMMSLGAVSKLFLVLQANCPDSVKEKARLVLRLHSGVWKDSPCLHSYLLSRYT
ncbi:unnamed protein product [Musa hybrid cultivar]